MALTVSWATGGNLGDVLAMTTQVAVNFWVSDTAAANLLVQGVIQGVLQSGQFVTSRAGYAQGTPNTVQTAQALTLPSPAMPAVPNSGTTFWQVECDPFTGVCTITTSASAFPAAGACAAPNAAVSRVILAQQALTSGTTNPSLVLFQPLDNW